MTLAVNKVYALCPAGDVETLAVSPPAALSPDSFKGQGADERLKELSALLPGISLRRVPRLARLALRAALEVKPENEQPLGLIMVSAYGSVSSTFEFLDSIITDGAEMASPTAFSHSVTNMSAAYLSQFLKINGPCLTLNQRSLPDALTAAEALLANGRIEGILLGVAAEKPEMMKAIELEAGHSTLPPDEGAVFFHLSRPNPDKEEVWLINKKSGSSSPPADQPNLDQTQLLSMALRLAIICDRFETGSIHITCGPVNSLIEIKKSGGFSDSA